MAFSLKSVSFVPKLNESIFGSKSKGVMNFCSSRHVKAKSNICSILNTDFMGKPIVVSEEKSSWYCSSRATRDVSINAQATICVSKALMWWKKNLKPNMIEIHSSQELVNSLVNAGDSLVVVHFYSPGCGGCKALHPKICQIAEQYPSVIFLKVNYEELKTMCHSLHIHVLPFFRFYRGSEGRVSSFSCTNATIKKFKDALEKHGNERCSLGPTKGLEESELENLVQESNDYSGVWSMASNNSRGLVQNMIYS